MKTGEYSDQLMRCLVHIIGRAAMPPEKVLGIVGRGPKQIKAFNLCDGTLSQKEVCKETGLDAGNLSRTFTRWVESGIAFWIGQGQAGRLLHIYPLATVIRAKPKKKTKR
ncbi:MAG: MarR family transcriptional regulator [Pyrinomonadaceae bacterium]